MKLQLAKRILFGTLGCMFLFQGNVLAQGHKITSGYNDLLAEKGGLIANGGTLENGAGVAAVQVEAPDGNGNYFLDPTSAEYTGKTIVNATGGGTTPESPHATVVANALFGNSSSTSAGITDITAYEVNDWIGTQMRLGGLDPAVQAAKLSNHSYAGTLAAVDAVEANMRMDFMIERDDFVNVVGTANSGATRNVFATSYNSIVVGKFDGTHASGVTPDYGPGRFKPDIVANNGATSFSTPVVGSAAAILLEAGSGTNGTKSEVIRSMIYAGATKEQFSTWDRTTTRPVDEQFGFGNMNILNSYHIFEGGEFAGSTSDPATDVGLFGWDSGTYDGTNDLFYDFEIEAGRELDQLSATLAWNAIVTDTDATTGFNGVLSLADLNLELYDSSGSFLGSLLDESVSTIYNYEHIYLENLAAGNYTFRVSGDSAQDFGFSWRITTVPEPGSAALLMGLGLAGLLTRRRRG